ncbi:hypothetical protein [Lewinella sp. 4G2]|uniref:hypothetical protein n=1 Tax=Lewinella sp. 4G2 TaxID=1803372 RepID=UPI0007B4A423|nr:hypothetical protein [Lewinella sp. 4G2]OAV45102.1 hypothetical protein A3850_011650 [Lewinella sp. 4G2]
MDISKTMPVNFSDLLNKIKDYLSSIAYYDLFISGQFDVLQSTMISYLQGIDLEVFKLQLRNEILNVLHENQFECNISVLSSKLNRSFLEYEDTDEYIDILQELSQLFFKYKYKVTTPPKEIGHHYVVAIKPTISNHLEFLSLLRYNCGGKEIRINIRQNLLNYLNHPLKYLDGDFYDFMPSGNTSFYEHNYFGRKVKSLESKDLATLLALKMALMSSVDLTTSYGKLFMQMQGGVCATVEVGKLGDDTLNSKERKSQLYKIKREHNAQKKYGDPYDFYSRGIKLYKQVGYASTSLIVDVPYGFYLLADEYVYEIRFNADPLLMNMNLPCLLSSSNLSSAKVDDHDELRQQNIDEDEDEHHVKLHGKI